MYRVKKNDSFDQFGAGVDNRLTEKVMFTDENILSVTQAHVEYCLDEAHDCKSKGDVALWKARARGAYEVWQALHREETKGSQWLQF